MTTLTFTDAAGNPLAATLVSPNTTNAAEITPFTITVQVSYTLWERIMRETLFHAWFAPDDHPSFDPDTAVQLELALSPNLEFPAAAFLALDEYQQENPTLFTTERWFLLNASQPVTLPGSLQGASSSLFIGGRTLWYPWFTGESKTVPAAPRPIDAIHAYFDDEEWLYEELNPTLWRIMIEGDDEEWTFLVKLDEEQAFCSAYSIFPELVPEAHRDAVAAYLSVTNYDLVVGNWEMDPLDGEVRFRTSIDYEGTDLTTPLVARIVAMNLQTAEEYFPEIRARLA